jgi:hypothetical protein
MTADDIHWPYVVFALAGAAALPFLYFLFQRRWTWIALVASVPNLFMVLINGAAPIRGALDPNYVGYQFGLLQADKGISVTLIAGSVFLASALSASIAIRNRPGLLMLIVAATSAFHLINFGLVFLDFVAYNPNAFSIQFGEYLTVPYTVAIPVWIMVFLLPFLLALPWALRRSFETE